MIPAPVVLFVYNRPDLTLRTLTALQQNHLAAATTLIIYADGPRANAGQEAIDKITKTREVIRSQTWCGNTIIREAAVNIGLAGSVIRGVSEVLQEYESVIVLEDDLETSTGFLQYMNTALVKYAAAEKVMQVSAFNFPITARGRHTSYFLPFITSWGWATWRRAWQYFDAGAAGYDKLATDANLRHAFNLQGAYPYADMMKAQMETKTIDSWAIRWWWSVFQQNGLVLYPDKSLVQNTGFGEDATHTSTKNNVGSSSLFDNTYAIQKFPAGISVDHRQYKLVTEFLSGNQRNKKAKNLKSFLTGLYKNIIKQ